MDSEAPTADEPQRLQFTDQQGEVQECELSGEDAVTAFWTFVSQRRGADNQVFTVEEMTERAGLRFDFERSAITRFTHTLADDGVTVSRTFELFTLIEEDERSHALVRALIDSGFQGTFPLAAWLPYVPVLSEADDDDEDDDAAEFVLRTDAGHAQRLRIRHPNDASYVPAAFLVRYVDHDVSLESSETGERLDVLRGRTILARSTGSADVDAAAAASARTEYMRLDRPNRVGTAFQLFFEDGFAGLDRFGQWFGDIEDLDLSPQERGAHRAAAFTAHADMLSEVGRLWAASGIVDQSDRYWIFFESQSLDDSEAERAELVALLTRLGIVTAPSPSGAAAGEIWVPRQAALDAEIDRWA